MKKSLAGLLFFFATSISAQTHFSPGYVIKSNGDTLHGFLQEEFRPNILTSLQFKDTSSPIETFTPEELKSFAYERGGIYKSISFRNSLDATTDTAEICFALQLVEGNYNLFSFIRKGQTYFVIKGNGLSYFLYNDVTNGNGEVLVEGNYSSRLRSLGASCKQASLISQEIDYSEKQIAVFINKLNNCISPGTSSVNHFKEAKIDIRFAAFAGGIYIDRYRNQVTLDGAAVLTYPQLSRNMSVHIGLHYAGMVRESHSKDYYGFVTGYVYKDYIFCIPLALQYNFTRGIIQPFVYGGFALAFIKENQATYYYNLSPSFSSSTKFGVSAIGAAGIEGHISQRFFVKAEWRFELYFQHPVLGLAYTF